MFTVQVKSMQRTDNLCSRFGLFEKLAKSVEYTIKKRLASQGE